MKRVILHIGRQKTGTTAVQRFLYANPSLLNGYGIHYPEYGIRGFGHHEIGGPISSLTMSKNGRSRSDIVEVLRRGLLDEIQDSNQLIVLSSESFQNCDPVWVGQLFRDCEVDVVVYLREQVGFLASAYAQKVQATDYAESLEKFCQDNLFPDYQRFMEIWNREFPSRIFVKLYDRNDMVQGDVVVDFCESFLRIPGDRVNDLRSRDDPNPTLTHDLIEFKLRVNRGCTLSPDNARQLFIGLAELSNTDTSGRISVPTDVIRKVSHHYDKSNRRLARKYFAREQLFTPFNQSSGIVSGDTLETRLACIREKLITRYPSLANPLAVLPV